MLGQAIKKLRQERGMKQEELGLAVGVSKQSVSNWENDNIQPSIEMLSKIADALSVTTDYLLGRDNRRYIDVTGISEDAIQHIQALLEMLKGQ